MGANAQNAKRKGEQRARRELAALRDLAAKRADEVDDTDKPPQATPQPRAAMPVNASPL